MREIPDVSLTHHFGVRTVTGSRGWVRICQHSAGPFRVVRGPLAGQVGIRKSDATKPFIPRHKYKMAPQRLTNSSGRSPCLCVLKNTHERERERENAAAAWIGTDGTGGAASQQREGKNLHASKKAQALAASSKSD